MLNQFAKELYQFMPDKDLVLPLSPLGEHLTCLLVLGYAIVYGRSKFITSVARHEVHKAMGVTKKMPGFV